MEQQPIVQPPVQDTPEQAHKRSASTAMILSIVGVVLVWAPVLNLAGLILSIIGFVRSKDNRAFAAANGFMESNTNTAGYVCGLVGIITGAVTILLTILMIGLLLAVAGGIYNMVILPEIM